MKIYNGNAMEVLQRMPAESVDCVVTSPPYWGLRAYQTESQVWDGDPNCKHIWEEIQSPKKEHHHGQGKSTLRNGNVSPEENWNKQTSNEGRFSNFCQKCGAWRGELGLEPDFKLYIKHLIQIFSEVKRVMKPTGTCFVNLGDTYWGGGGGNYKSDSTIDTRKDKGVHTTIKWQGDFPAKSLCGVPERFMLAMTDELGFIRRNSIIWHKLNCMPSSAGDRFTVDWEPVFYFVKSNDALFWVNEKTSAMVKKQPPGTKGIEGIDWDWKIVGEEIPDEKFNIRTREVARGHIKSEQYRATEEEIKNHGKGKLKKVSNWTANDYWFEKQLEEYTAPLNRWGGDKLEASGVSEWDQGTGQSTYRDRDMRPDSRGRNKRCVWSIATQPSSLPHFAMYPEDLVEPMIKSGCPEFICKKCGLAREKIFKEGERIETGGKRKKDTPGIGNKNINTGYIQKIESGYSDCGCDHSDGWNKGVVLDPFAGMATTGLVALLQGKDFIGIDVSREYCKMAKGRIEERLGLFYNVEIVG